MNLDGKSVDQIWDRILVLTTSVDDSRIDGKPNNPSGWLTFNQFFARELNPGLRPIDSPGDNSVVTAPADCTFRKMYPIDENSNIKKSVESLLDIV